MSLGEAEFWSLSTMQALSLSVRDRLDYEHPHII